MNALNNGYFYDVNLKSYVKVIENNQAYRNINWLGGRSGE